MKSMCSRKSFTLVELLTVMAIIAVLMGLVLGMTRVANRMICEARTKAIIKQISVALESYKAKYGYYIQSNNAEANRFFLDKTLSTGGVDGTLIINNFCQFIDFQSMIGGRSSQKTDVTETNENNIVYYLIDGFRQPLIYRCPGFFNRSGFDLGSVGEDGRWGVTGSNCRLSNGTFADIPSADAGQYRTNFGLGDDITNFVR